MTLSLTLRQTGLGVGEGGDGGDPSTKHCDLLSTLSHLLSSYNCCASHCTMLFPVHDPLFTLYTVQRTQSASSDLTIINPNFRIVAIRNSVVGDRKLFLFCCVYRDIFFFIHEIRAIEWVLFKKSDANFKPRQRHKLIMYIKLPLTKTETRGQ